MVPGTLSPTHLGFIPLDREILDMVEYYTMVSKAAFSAAGEVRYFELFVGATDRGMRVGIYSPTHIRCQFTLVQQKEWSSFPEGYNMVIYAFVIISICKVSVYNYS